MPSGTPKQKRRALTLWYDHMGPHCGYCGIKLVSLAEALRINDRNAMGVRVRYTKAQRRIAENHPTIDHVVPSAKGGSNQMKNYAVVCQKCNNEKLHHEHPGLSLALKEMWFRAIDAHLDRYGSLPYPDPY